MNFLKSLAVRIFLVHLFFVALSGYFVLKIVMDEIKPGVRQSTEETLIDTANLLAEILRDDVKQGTLNQSKFPEVLRAYGQRHPHANIWGIEKADINHRIYVTDRFGTVLLDSANQAVGKDYSKWNDVLRTLRGEYGARSTQAIPGDPFSTVMHVAAPIMDGTQIIGVVTVAKPNRTLQPFIDRTQKRLLIFGGAIILAGVLAGVMLSMWLSASIRRLRKYALDVSEGRRADPPTSTSGELRQLANALESMRVQLEGKAYVERYVQTLTHELKSPLAAIHGASELLKQDMPPEQRKKFIDNIDIESTRMEQLIGRLLNLAVVEQRRHLEDISEISVRELIDSTLSSFNTRVEAKHLRIESHIADEPKVMGERFLLQQALSNLLDNAIDFSTSNSTIRITTIADDQVVKIAIWNQSNAIPEFALPRLTERFYSLPRPDSGRKSTGLGLNFVQEVAELHQGSLTVRNVNDGVEAELAISRK